MRFDNTCDYCGREIHGPAVWLSGLSYCSKDCRDRRFEDLCYHRGEGDEVREAPVVAREQNQDV
jgi:hypothetical protein